MNKRHIKIRPDDVRSATMFPAAGNTGGDCRALLKTLRQEPEKANQAISEFSQIKCDKKSCGR